MIAVSALSLLGYFDHIYMLFELMTHFKLQYLLVSVVCFFFMLINRKYGWLVICVLCIGANAAVIIPWYLNPVDEVGAHPDSSLKIILSNVNVENRDYAGALILVERERPDIIILQEVNSGWMDGLAELRRHYPYIISKLRDDNFGIAMFSRVPWKKAETMSLGKADVPSVIADMKVNGKMIRLMASHPMPPVSKDLFDLRNDQIEEIGDFIVKQPVPVILAGDLNMTVWSSYYKKLISKAGLKNARQGFGLLPTWPTMLPAMMIPLDHFLYTADFNVIDIRTAGSIGSDHLPVVAQFEVL